MAEWGFSLGSAGTGYIYAAENWNASTQVSMHHRIRADKSGAWYSGSGGTWNANFGGLTNSGAFNYVAGTQSYTFWEFDHTFNKDANGNINIGVYGYVNGDNPPGVGAGSRSETYTPARIGVNPTMNNPVASNISVVTATISGTNANNGLGTSTTVYLRYKKTADSDATYQQSQTTSWNLTGLTPGTSYTIQIYGANNNGDTAGWTNTQTFTTLPAPSTSTALLGIIGVH